MGLAEFMLIAEGINPMSIKEKKIEARAAFQELNSGKLSVSDYWSIVRDIANEK